MKAPRREAEDVRRVASGKRDDPEFLLYLVAVAEGSARNARWLAILEGLDGKGELVKPLQAAFKRGDAPPDGPEMEIPWAMVPCSIPRNLRCHLCLTPYCLLDARQRLPRPHPYRGIEELATDCGWQLETLKKHLYHLHDAGLVKLSKRPGRGEGWSETTYTVIHNPARGLYADPHGPTTVWDEVPARRWRPRNGLERLSRTNARRDAPSVRGDGDDGHPAHRDARRDAPSVRNSPKDGSGKAGERGDPPDVARRASRSGVTHHGIEYGTLSVRGFPSSSEVWDYKDEQIRFYPDFLFDRSVNFDEDFGDDGQDEDRQDVDDGLLDLAPSDPVPPRIRFSWAEADTADEIVRAVGDTDQWNGGPWPA